MLDLLLPSDDRVVVVEVALALVGGAVAMFLARHRPDMRVLVGGIWILTLAVLALRAVH